MSNSPPFDVESFDCQTTRPSQIQRDNAIATLREFAGVPIEPNSELARLLASHFAPTVFQLDSCKRQAGCGIE